MDTSQLTSAYCTIASSFWLNFFLKLCFTKDRQNIRVCSDHNWRSKMVTKYENSMMDNLYWWGIPTLFRCPNEPLKNQDIALVGVPHSVGNGTTERDQHLGPRAVRNISSLQRRVHGELQIDPWTELQIVDAGDVPFPKANDNEDCIEQITNFFHEIDKTQETDYLNQTKIKYF